MGENIYFEINERYTMQYGLQIKFCNVAIIRTVFNDGL